MSAPNNYYVAQGPPYTVVRTIAGSQTAGTEYTYTVAAGHLQRLISWFFTFVTGSATSSRFMGYKLLDDSANVIYRGSVTNNINTATTTTNVSISPRAPVNLSNNTAQAMGLQIPDMWLWPGCQLVTFISNGTGGAGVTSGDQYTVMNLFFEDNTSITGYSYP